MSVEELVKRLRKKQERVHDLSGVGYIDDPDCQQAADKLEELAAENERVRRERVEANNEWRKAYNELTVKAEAALAEKDKEIAVLREALEPFALEYEARARLAPGPDIDHWPIGGSALTYKHIRIAYEASRNAGGKDGE